MNLSDRKRALVVVATLLIGCAGPGSPLPAPGADAGGAGLAFSDSGPGPSWFDSAAGSLDGAVNPAPDLPSSTACPNGNLLASLPALPALCRPFPQATASPAAADPPSCQTTPKVDLSEAADQFIGTDTVRDYVSGLGGEDVISGMGCSDQINGNQGDDWINGNQGNDLIRGGQGNDTIYGGQGNDEIWGDLGNDTLSGDLDDDRYNYAEGDGHDVIEEKGGFDVIVCASKTGYPKARITGWSRVGDDLYLVMSGSGSIQIKAYFTSADSSIDMISGCQ